MRFDLRVKNWHSYIPILGVIRHYRPANFIPDVGAGVVVGIITVPQAIAYAFLAGLPAEAGLYACLLPMVIYALLGSSRHLVVGPVAVAALMIAAAVGQYSATYDYDHLAVSIVICLQAGLFLWLLRVWNMGGVVNLLSHPVIVGFVNAAVLIIIISQLGALTGIPEGNNGNLLQRLQQQAENVASLNVATTLIGIACIGLLWFIRVRSIPWLQAVFRPFGMGGETAQIIARLGPLIVAAAATLLVWAFDLDGETAVATVGYVPPGLPTLTVPPMDFTMWMDLAPTSAIIAVVAYVESFTIGTMLATKERSRLNANQELIALGAANIGAAFSGAYPVAGSFSRSIVNYQTGARTPLSSLVCALLIVVTLMYLTPLFTRLPHAALAAIIIVAVTSLLDFRSIRSHWRIHPEDSITQVATMVTVLTLGIETGLLIGVGLSVAFFVRYSSRPNVVVVGRIGDTQQFRSIKRHQAETPKHVTAVRVDENLYFANANQVENKLLKVIQRRPDTKHLVLVCSAVNLIDVSGLEMLQRVNDNFAEMGITLHLSDIKGPVMDHLEEAEFIASLTGKVFFTVDQAMRELAPDPATTPV